MIQTGAEVSLHVRTEKSQKHHLCVRVMFFIPLLCNNTFILELGRLWSDQRLAYGAFAGCERQPSRSGHLF